MSYDPNYRMRFRPTSPARLSRYAWQLPMKGDPAGCVGDWAKRCALVYAYMMAAKRGVIPVPERRGLWFYSESGME